MKRDWHRYRDSENIVHLGGAMIAVNSGLCGNNDAVDETDDPVTCAVCVAVVDHVYKHRRAALTPRDHGEAGKI